MKNKEIKQCKHGVKYLYDDYGEAWTACIKCQPFAPSKYKQNVIRSRGGTWWSTRPNPKNNPPDSCHCHKNCPTREATYPCLPNSCIHCKPITFKPENPTGELEVTVSPNGRTITAKYVAPSKECKCHCHIEGMSRMECPELFGRICESKIKSCSHCKVVPSTKGDWELDLVFL